MKQQEDNYNLNIKKQKKIKSQVETEIKVYNVKVKQTKKENKIKELKLKAIKKNKNMHLTLGTGLNRYNNNYFSGNEYGTNKVLLVNKSFKFQKNKLVLCRKVDISHNNSRNNEDEKDISSKSEENFKIHKRTNNNSDILGENKLGKNINEYDRQNNRYSNLG